jgi:hypothetical protein
MFSVDGRCLDQPCEPEGGKLRGNVRQPWYPLEERYGLSSPISARRRRSRCCRGSTCSSSSARASRSRPTTPASARRPADHPCNWLQHWENVVDSLHVPILQACSRATSSCRDGADARVPLGSDRARACASPAFAISTAAGACIASPRRRCRRFGSCRAASGSFGPVESIGWVLPIDDFHFRVYVAGRLKQPGDIGRMRSKMNASSGGS